METMEIVLYVVLAFYLAFIYLLAHRADLPILVKLAYAAGLAVGLPVLSYQSVVFMEANASDAFHGSDSPLPFLAFLALPVGMGFLWHRLCRLISRHLLGYQPQEKRDYAARMGSKFHSLRLSAIMVACVALLLMCTLYFAPQYPGAPFWYICWGLAALCWYGVVRLVQSRRRFVKLSQTPAVDRPMRVNSIQRFHLTENPRQAAQYGLTRLLGGFAVPPKRVAKPDNETSLQDPACRDLFGSSKIEIAVELDEQFYFVNSLEGFPEVGQQATFSIIPELGAITAIDGKTFEHTAALGPKELKTLREMVAEMPKAA